MHFSRRDQLYVLLAAVGVAGVVLTVVGVTQYASHKSAACTPSLSSDCPSPPPSPPSPPSSQCKTPCQKGGCCLVGGKSVLCPGTHCCDQAQSYDSPCSNPPPPPPHPTPPTPTPPPSGGSLCNPASAGGTRKVILSNNCDETRWFKFDGKTTPTFIERPPCAWSEQDCTMENDTQECTTPERGVTYCRKNAQGQLKCACNPFYQVEPGQTTVLEIPDGASWGSATSWLASGCNANGAQCAVGDSAAMNSLMEFTYDTPDRTNTLYYDLSAVNSWTTASPVGMKTCGGARSSSDPYRCTGLAAAFDVNKDCPDGSNAFPPGDGPDGDSANLIPTGTVFNPHNVGGTEWTWTGAPDFARGWGYAEGLNVNRRYVCDKSGCREAKSGEHANICMGGCDLCTATQHKGTNSPECIKYCCPDMKVQYPAGSDHTYRYDSQGCRALGVQPGQNYTTAWKKVNPNIYTYAYEDRSSSYTCDPQQSLAIQSCPNHKEF